MEICVRFSGSTLFMMAHDRQYRVRKICHVVGRGRADSPSWRRWRSPASRASPSPSFPPSWPTPCRRGSGGGCRGPTLPSVRWPTPWGPSRWRPCTIEPRIAAIQEPCSSWPPPSTSWGSSSPVRCRRDRRTVVVREIDSSDDRKRRMVQRQRTRGHRWSLYDVMSCDVILSYT